LSDYLLPIIEISYDSRTWMNKYLFYKSNDFIFEIESV
jgi:hypothetical protein